MIQLELIPYVTYSNPIGDSYPDVSINLASYKMNSRKIISDYGYVEDKGLHYDLKSADESRESQMPGSKIFDLGYDGKNITLLFRNGDARRHIEENWVPK